MALSLLCPAPHCRTRGRHTPDCDGGECQGCLPRKAADGLRLCEVCVRRISEDARTAARLHDDLTQTLIRTGRGTEPTSGSSAGAPVPDDDVMEARDAIYRTLTSLVQLISYERGVVIPWEWRTEELPEGFIGPPRRIRVGVGHANALAQFVTLHAVWLAAHPAAGEHAGDLRDIAGDGRTWRLAYPVGSDQQYLGPCGGTVDIEATAGCPVDCDCHNGPHYPCSEPGGCGSAGCGRTRQEPCTGDVYAKPGAEKGSCRVCSATYDVAEREEWLYDQVLPAYSFRASEIAHAYNIPAYWIRFQAFSRPEERRADGTLLKPARHARLLPHDHDPSGRPRYLIRDVLALWQAEQERREANRARRARTRENAA